jgi:hypothetical protein
MKIPRLAPRHLGNQIAVAACCATILTSACGSSTASGQQVLDAHGNGGATSGGTGGTSSLGAGGTPGTGGTSNGADGGQGTGGTTASGGVYGTGGVAGTGGTQGSGGVPGSGGGKGTGGTTVLDAGADAATGCPAQLPLSGGDCSGPLTCTYGQASCCGITSSAWPDYGVQLHLPGQRWRHDRRRAGRRPRGRHLRRRCLGRRRGLRRRGRSGLCRGHLLRMVRQRVRFAYAWHVRHHPARRALRHLRRPGVWLRRQELPQHLRRGQGRRRRQQQHQLPRAGGHVPLRLELLPAQRGLLLCPGGRGGQQSGELRLRSLARGMQWGV